MRKLLRKPGNWPVRWRLAGVSAGLTLMILLAFGAVIGQVTTNRVRDDFNHEVRNAAQTLAREFRIVYTPFGTISFQKGPRLDDFVRPDDASARVFDVSGGLVKESSGAAEMGSLTPGLSDRGQLRVATTQIISETGLITGYVQYGRSFAHVNSTIDRLWLFIAAVILAGTLLAGLAGLAIAARAMRPISARTPKSTTRSASWPGPWSRCCARWTPLAASARRR